MHKLEILAKILKNSEDFREVNLNKSHGSLKGTQSRLRFKHLPSQRWLEINKRGRLLTLIDRLKMKIIKVWDYEVFESKDLVNYLNKELRI